MEKTASAKKAKPKTKRRSKPRTADDVLYEAECVVLHTLICFDPAYRHLGFQSKENQRQAVGFLDILHDNLLKHTNRRKPKKSK